MTATFAPATEKQIAFVRSLASERGVTLKEEVMARLSKTAASASIEKLLALPKPAPAPIAASSNVPPSADYRATANSVPAGRYALRDEDHGGTVVKFYRVSKPEEGKWAGYTFVDIQASDEFYPVRGRTKFIILESIAADPQGAAILYGRELGVCGICGRTLTDEESRAYGIGPVCREKSGW